VPIGRYQGFKKHVQKLSNLTHLDAAIQSQSKSVNALYGKLQVLLVEAKWEEAEARAVSNQALAAVALGSVYLLPSLRSTATVVLGRGARRSLRRCFIGWSTDLSLSPGFRRRPGRRVSCLQPAVGSMADFSWMPGLNSKGQSERSVFG